MVMERLAQGKLSQWPKDPSDITCGEISRRYFRGMVGTAIFCPRCRDVLDCRGSVHVEKKFRRAKTATIVCAKCFDSEFAPRIPAALRSGINVEILDGRRLFPEGRETGTKPTPERRTRKADVAVGQIWSLKVSGRLVRGKVIRQYEKTSPYGKRLLRTVWDVLNLTTGRTITVRSAQRFRQLISEES